MSEIDHRKIAKEFDEFSTKLIVCVPHLSSLFALNNYESVVRLHSDISRDIIENLLLEKPIPVKDFFEHHIVDRRPITINVSIDVPNGPMVDFFRRIAGEGALIEMIGEFGKSSQASSGYGCGNPGCSSCDYKYRNTVRTPVTSTDVIDLTSETKPSLLKIRYLAYLPVANSSPPKYIILDIVWGTTNNYFTVDLCKFPRGTSNDSFYTGVS